MWTNACDTLTLPANNGNPIGATASRSRTDPFVTYATQPSARRICVCTYVVEQRTDAAVPEPFIAQATLESLDGVRDSTRVEPPKRFDELAGKLRHPVSQCAGRVASPCASALFRGTHWPRPLRRSGGLSRFQDCCGGPRSASGERSGGEMGSASSAAEARRHTGGAAGSAADETGGTVSVGGTTTDRVGGSSKPRLKRRGDGFETGRCPAARTTGGTTNRTETSRKTTTRRRATTDPIGGIRSIRATTLLPVFMLRKRSRAALSSHQLAISHQSSL